MSSFSSEYQNNYKDIDIIIYNNSIKNLETVLESKKKVINTIISENKDDSFKLFEVLNDTARKLTVLDLLKNYFVKHLKNKFDNSEWKLLKADESEIKGVNLINDLIKSEGYTKTSREYFKE